MISFSSNLTFNARNLCHVFLFCIHFFSDLIKDTTARFSDVWGTIRKAIRRNLCDFCPDGLFEGDNQLMSHPYNQLSQTIELNLTAIQMLNVKHNRRIVIYGLQLFLFFGRSKFGIQLTNYSIQGS